MCHRPVQSARPHSIVLAAGSEKEAAHRLGLSHSTVKHHLANARSRVGAETTAQLVWILAPRLPEPSEPGGSLAVDGTDRQGRSSEECCDAIGSGSSQGVT
jgi:hypothetical protein